MRWSDKRRLSGPGTLLRRAIEADRLVSVIFYGPPGTGKTTLAQVIANATRARFETLECGLVRRRGHPPRDRPAAEDERKLYGGRTVLFIDEIHRFNKSQQDALLPLRGRRAC